MSVELATAYINLVPSAKGLKGLLEKELGGAGSSAGESASKSFGAKFTGGMAGIGKAAGVGLGVGLAGAAGIGKALFDMGASFDDAYDKIRSGTGATGDALAGLQDDFKAVSTAVPASFEDASTAITNLNQRLGLTGKPLQDLSAQFLDLSRVTGTDLTTNVDTLSRVFGDWGVATEDQAGTLDKVFRASQKSGIGIDTLGQSVVQFGAPLRNLGFGFDESVALLAKFSKEGVNTETVFAGMKAGVGKLAKAGEDVPATFRRVVGEITKLGPGTEATAKSIELFGQRAGPDLADAIAGGKFEVAGMLDAISNGSDTVGQAGQDTADFGEKLQMLKNDALIKLEPVALRVFDAIGKAVESATPFVKEVAAGFGAMFAAFTGGGDGVEKEGIGKVLEDIGIKAKEIFDKVGPIVTDFVDAIKGVDWAKVLGDVAGFITPIADAFVKLALAVADFAAEQWPKVEAVLPTIKEFVELLGQAFADTISFLADKMNILGPALAAVATAMVAIKAAEIGAEKWTALKDGVNSVSDKVKHLNSNFDKFLKKSKDAAAAAGRFGTKLKDAIVDNAKKAGDALKSAGTKVVDFGKSMVKGAVDIAKNTAAFVANKAAIVAQKIANAAGAVVTGVATAATAAFNFVMALNPVVLVVIAIVALIAILVLAYKKVDWFRAFVDKAFTLIKDAITTAINIAWQVIQTVFEVIKTVITTYVEGYLLVITTVFNAIKAAIEFAINLAWDVIVAVFNGIKDTISTVIDTIKTVATTGFDLLKGIITKPIELAKETVATLFDGIKDLFTGLPDKLKDGLSSLADTIAKPFKAMAEAIRDAWNSSIGGKGFSIPDIPGVPGAGKRVEIPTLHAGGPVTGRPGREVLRLLEAGEWVLNRNQVASLRASGRTPAGIGAGGGAGMSIGTLQVNAVANASADEVVAAINSKLGWAHTTRRDR